MSIGPETRAGRLAQRISLHPTFQRFGPSIMPRIDRGMHKISGGRVMIGQMMLPMVMLEHTGAKTGEPRRTPLASMPDGDGFWLVGSNYGRSGHPAWSANLLAHPDVAIVHKGKRRELRARLVDGPERDKIWPQLTTFWPGYAAYAEMNEPTQDGGRVLRIFRLDPR